MTGQKFQLSNTKELFMGSHTYSFLSNSLLFVDDFIENDFNKQSFEELQKVLEDYRKHCLDNIEELFNEVNSNQSALKVFSTLDEFSLDRLLQSAFYIEQYIVDDPLFKLTHIEGKVSKVTKEYLGFERSKLDKSKLAQICKKLKSITPMIVADYVKLLPISYKFEPEDHPPVSYSENYFADSLPKDLMQFFHERVTVNSLQKDESGWKVLDESDLTPGLYINFKNGSKRGMIYHYFEQEFLPFDDPKKLSFTQKLADYPMDKLKHEAWVFQSINRTAKATFDQVFQENLIAASLKATYLCGDRFTADLLTRNMGAKESIQTSTANEFINLDLPFLENVDIQTLMDIRQHESEVFSNFRVELEKQFRSLRGIDDKTELELKRQEIIHELNEVQIQKINQKVKSLRKKALSESLIVIGGLAGAVQTSGWSLLAAAIALNQGYKSYNEYKDGIKENPSYLLWKTVKRTK